MDLSKPNTQLDASRQGHESTLRDLVLSRAGLSPEKMGQMLQQAVEVLEDKLVATDTKYFSHQGKVTAEREVTNHKIQMEAASEIVRLVSALGTLARQPARPGQSHQTDGPVVAIQVNMPPDRDPTPTTPVEPVVELPPARAIGTHRSQTGPTVQGDDRPPLGRGGSVPPAAPPDDPARTAQQYTAGGLGPWPEDSESYLGTED